jgi:hypothetical protein
LCKLCLIGLVLIHFEILLTNIRIIVYYIVVITIKTIIRKCRTSVIRNILQRITGHSLLAISRFSAKERRVELNINKKGKWLFNLTMLHESNAAENREPQLQNKRGAFYWFYKNIHTEV